MNTEIAGNPEKESTWERTSASGVLRHKSGRYYGRLRVAGKDKFFALKTKVLEVARKRYSDERAKNEKVRKAAKKAGDGIANMGNLLTLYRASIHNKAASEMTDARKTRLIQHSKYIETTWPEFAALHPSEINQSSIGVWRSRALTEGTGYRPPGAKGGEGRGKSAFSFNAALDCVRQLLDIAVDNAVIHANPLIGRRGLKATYEPKKATLPSRDQLQAVFAAIENGTERGGWALETADFCRFLAYTGCRRSEGVAVTWQHVDFAAGLLMVPGTKTTAAKRRLPLVPAAKNLLERILERRKKAATVPGPDGLSFVAPSAPVLMVHEAQKSLDKACAKVGVARLVHHDLRDCFATSCIEAGIDIPTIARWLGHVDGGALLMKTYGHLRDDHSKDMAAKVNFGGAS